MDDSPLVRFRAAALALVSLLSLVAVRALVFLRSLVLVAVLAR